MTRVQRAHQAPLQRPAGHRVPLVQRRAKPQTGIVGWVRSYPWLTTFLVLLIAATAVLTMRQAQVGPWAPKAKPVQAVCDTTTHTCNKAPLMVINKNHSYTATITTDKGDIKLDLNAQTSPLAVNNFVFLARQGFYNGLTFDRLEQPGQVSSITNQPSNLDLIQGGAGGKNGGPGYSLQFDTPSGSYPAGSVAMANESQFFISLADNTQAIPNGKFTTFGTLEPGSLDVAKKLRPNDKITGITVDESSVAPTPTPSPTATPAPTNTPAPTATPKK